MSEREVLARRLRVERAARGWGLKEAAEKIGIQRDTLSALEKGRRGVYSGTLERIAHAYNLSLAELLGEETTLAGKARAPATGQPPKERETRREARGEVPVPKTYTAEEVKGALELTKGVVQTIIHGYLYRVAFEGLPYPEAKHDAFGALNSVYDYRSVENLLEQVQRYGVGVREEAEAETLEAGRRSADREGAEKR